MAKDKSSSSSSAKPVHEIRFGRIKAAIWENDTQNGTRHNVTLQRIYKDDEGNWQVTSSFGRDDLPLLCKVTDLAHSWIYQQSAAESPQERF